MDKVRANQKKWREANKDKAKAFVRSSILKQKYGIDLEEYQQLVIAQNGLCGICGNKPKQYTSKTGARYRYLVVDHNHITGQIRGLLCHTCNIALGNLADDPVLFENAIAYVRRSNESTS